MYAMVKQEAEAKKAGAARFNAVFVNNYLQNKHARRGESGLRGQAPKRGFRQ